MEFKYDDKELCVTLENISQVHIIFIDNIEKELATISVNIRFQLKREYFPSTQNPIYSTSESTQLRVQIQI